MPSREPSHNRLHLGVMKKRRCQRCERLICKGPAMRAGRWIANFRPQPCAITRAANDPRHGQFGHYRLTLGGDGKVAVNIVVV